MNLFRNYQAPTPEKTSLRQWVGLCDSTSKPASLQVVQKDCRPAFRSAAAFILSKGLLDLARAHCAVHLGTFRQATWTRSQALFDAGRFPDDILNILDPMLDEACH
jgi:hypothetical protein